MSEFLMREKRRSGFTLIELLIVVAIIAILAAIAIPNFLEAQIRSKVSRIKADMRTMALGMEAYRVDSNQYLPTNAGGFGPVSDAEARRRTGLSDPNGWDWMGFCGTLLTTPVAYLTSVPTEEPFGMSAKDTDASWHNKLGLFLMVRLSPRAMALLNRNCLWPFAGPGENAVFPNLNHKGVPWAITSGGPDGWWWANMSLPQPYEFLEPYDPTNGTVSFGNIFWLGGGYSNK